MSFFKSKSTTYDPMSAYTPQQREAIQALMSLASTGSGGGITLGTPYGGSLGFYDQMPGEMQALSGLQGLLGGQEITGARDTFSRMAENRFDPSDPTSGYAAFSRALAKSGAESADVLNREAAMTGSRFGTGIQRAKSDLSEDLANQRGMFLAQLYNQGENRALAGAQGLTGLVGQQQSLFGQLASQAAVERLLKDQQAKEQYNEFGRQRNEQLARLDLMKDQWQQPMGAITTKTKSGFSQLAGTIMNSAGQALGAGIGGWMTGGIGNLFSGLSQGNVPGTGLFGTRLGGQTQSQILGFNTAQYR
jgi:hypothetical protein